MGIHPGCTGRGNASLHHSAGMAFTKQGSGTYGRFQCNSAACHLAQASEPLWAPGSSSAKWNLCTRRSQRPLLSPMIWMLPNVKKSMKWERKRGSGGGVGEHPAHQQNIWPGFSHLPACRLFHKEQGFACLFHWCCLWLWFFTQKSEMEN